MNKENPDFSLDCFRFNEREQLYNVIHHRRLLALLNQPEVQVRRVELSLNAFGEYLFITLTCGTGVGRRSLTFYGLGYHEYRERWATDGWQWYQTDVNRQLPTLSKMEVLRQLEERRVWCEVQGADAVPPSRRAEIFGMIAEISDEDGALTDLEDFGWWLFGDDGM